MNDSMIGFRTIPEDWGYVKKHAMIVECAKAFGLSVLVETGTYLGYTVSAMLPYFSDIYSIELGTDLYQKTKELFEGNPKVHLFLGDSGKVLWDVLPSLTKKPLFWLDGHYSGGITARGEDFDTPIMQELDAILSLCPDCVILIDDAWSFTGEYPKGVDYRFPVPSLSDLKSYVLSRVSGWTSEVKDEIILLRKQGGV